MSKLTLSVDAKVAARAKKYARDKGTSVSRLVETYLSTLAAPPAPDDAELPPVLRQLRGILKDAKFPADARQAYRDYLSEKYR